jgi:hypothetical protein
MPVWESKIRQQTLNLGLCPVLMTRKKFILDVLSSILQNYKEEDFGDKETWRFVTWSFSVPSMNQGSKFVQVPYFLATQNRSPPSNVPLRVRASYISLLKSKTDEHFFYSRSQAIKSVTFDVGRLLRKWIIFKSLFFIFSRGSWLRPFLPVAFRETYYAGLRFDLKICGWDNEVISSFPDSVLVVCTLFYEPFWLYKLDK